MLPTQYVRFHHFGNATLVHLHGLDGIKMATGIPDGVRDFLYLHARQLPPTEVDNYIVNVQVAEQWFQTHPEPDFIRQAAEQAMSPSSCSSSEHCNVISTHCFAKAVEHASCESQRQVERVREQWQADWDHWMGQVQQIWHEAAGCMSDHTLSPADGSFQFAMNPQFPVSFSTSGHSSNTYGGSSGNINGTATLGVPLNGSFDGELQVSYIPCLPFAIRPKHIGGSGTLGVGATLDGRLNASGQFHELVTVPPQGMKIPVYVIPVVLGTVPVAELDVSVYLEGNVAVNGKGTLNGHVNLQAHENTAYQFRCTGGGCDAAAQRVPVPDTATESVQLQGRVDLRPAVYAAVQLDLDWDVLSARVGPEPYLLGEIYGCEYASGSQSTSGNSTEQENHALTADVDWGLDLRADALAGGKKFWTHNWKMAGGHLLFTPLAPSNALIPEIAGALQTPAGQPAAYQVKMPACYPYSDPIQYALKWTGRATAGNTGRGQATPVSFLGRMAGSSNNSGSCTFGSEAGECWGSPQQPISLGLIWAQAGTYTLSVAAIRDRHGRKFPVAPGGQEIVVQQQSVSTGNK